VLEGLFMFSFSFGYVIILRVEMLFLLGVIGSFVVMVSEVGGVVMVFDVVELYGDCVVIDVMCDMNDVLYGEVII